MFFIVTGSNTTWRIFLISLTWLWPVLGFAPRRSAMNLFGDEPCTSLFSWSNTRSIKTERKKKKIGKDLTQTSLSSTRFTYGLQQLTWTGYLVLLSLNLCGWFQNKNLRLQSLFTVEIYTTWHGIAKCLPMTWMRACGHYCLFERWRVSFWIGTAWCLMVFLKWILA